MASDAERGPSKHDRPTAHRALPAVMMGEVGELKGQRLALPRAFERVHPKDGSEERRWKTLLKPVQRGLAEDEVTVVKIRDWLEAGITR